MAKTIVLTGLFAPWPGPFEDGLEVWSCNRGYAFQENLSRLFFFDADWRLQEHGHKDFIKHLAELDIPIITREKREDIPTSETYPLQEVMEDAELLPRGLGKLTIAELLEKGNPFFTSTIAYMFALAIYERPEVIVLHRLLTAPGSTEYFGQLECLNFWLGQALGKKIFVQASADSNIGKPYPWQSPLYGYVESDGLEQANDLLSAVIKPIMRSPRVFRWNPDADMEKMTGGQVDPLPAMSVTPEIIWKDGKAPPKELRS